MYAEFLAVNRWRSEIADDGPSALAKAIDLKPDAITIESWLPVIDGIRATEILKADSHTSAIPVIAVTGDVRAGHLQRLTAAGCAAILKKPCLPETLLSAVRLAIVRARAVRRHSDDLRVKAEGLKQRSIDLQERSDAIAHRLRAVSVKTTTPEIPPPPLNCPSCATLLVYDYSMIGGVRTHREQWDYLRCPNGCGTFQYRQRTRRVRPA